jgi:serine/threonine protein kinase
VRRPSHTSAPTAASAPTPAASSTAATSSAPAAPGPATTAAAAASASATTAPAAAAPFASARAAAPSPATGEDQLSIETLVGDRYAVVETLGSGGMAVVYRARDQELERDVAIKVLPEHLVSDGEVRERFEREARLVGRLSHPNIVNVYDVGKSEGRPYIVMECVDGVTLADELARRGRFPPAEAVELAMQACAGLEHAHEHGLVHRDIKTRNLLLRPDGVLKIADFGIARAVEGTQITASGTVLGTAVYAAPEQASGEQVTTAADIYSLGAVLYELISGRPPFEYESLPELVLKQRAGRVASLRDSVPDVTRHLDEVVLRCLAPEPSARPASARAVAQELAQEAGSEEPTAVARPPMTRARSRLRVWPAAAIAAGLIVLVAGVVVATQDDDSPPASNTPTVEPVPAGSTPEERARNLADWIRENSG